MVDVSNKYKTITVEVASKNGNTVVAASSDTAQYWSNQSHTFAEQSKQSAQEAKNWANKLGETIDGTEYSAKHYARLANSYIEGFEEVVINNTNNINVIGSETLSDIENVRAEAVESVTAIATTGVASVDEKVNTGIANIEAKTNVGVELVEATQTNAVNAVNTSKNEALNAINQTGVNNLANKDLSNLSATGEARFASGLNNKITNCLLEVPQNIKLELNNGILTLKAGSKVIVPNGTGVFDEVVIENDIAYSALTHATVADRVVFVRASGNGLLGLTVADTSSGATQPSSPRSAHVWYDTTNNIVKHSTDTGATWTGGLSLPICIGNYIQNTGFTSIDQTFNGFGYIGSHFWVDKGVKGLSANGRNADGTLNNTEFVTSRVMVNTTNNTNHYNALFLDVGTNVNVKGIRSYYADFIHKIKSRAELPLATAQNYQYYFIEDEAIWVMNGTTGVWNKTSIVEVGNLYHGADSSIADFKTINPFRAVDYNDFANTPHIIETYQNGTSWYRVYSDGWCEQGGIYTVPSSATVATISLLKSYSDTNYFVMRSNISTNTADTTNRATSISIKTSSSFDIYTSTSSVIPKIMWYTCGYIA